MLSPRMVGAVATSLAALVLGGAPGAQALTPGTWGPVAPLPSGTTSVGDQVLSSPTGALLRYAVVNNVPTLATFGASGLGPAVPIPGAPTNAVPGPVAFLPDGRAVVSFSQFSSGPLRLIVRFPDGHFGPVYSLPSSALSFAARAGEVLVLGQDSNGPNFTAEVIASSLSIAADGTLTPVGGAAGIYDAPGQTVDPYGTQIDVPVASLDADGQAEALFKVDHVSASGDDLLDVHRTADGHWGVPHSLSAGLPGGAFVGDPTAAVAPGGRTLAAFQTGDGTAYKNTLWRTLREPDQSYGTPTIVNDLAAAGGVRNTVLAASAGDGTLAIADLSFSCSAASTAIVPTEALTALVAAPGGQVTSYPVGILDTSATESRLQSLGTGAGQAIVGVNDQVTTGGNPDNVCNSVVTNDNVGTVSDRVSIVGPNASGDHTFGSGQFAMQGNGSVMLSADAEGLDSSGNAAVTGRLQTSGVAASAWFQGTGGALAPPSGGGGGGGAAPAPGPGPATVPPPVKLVPAPANTSSLTPVPGPVTISSSGVVTFTLTAPTLGPSDVLGEQIALQVFAGAAHTAAVAKATKQPKLIGTVKKSLRLRSKQKVTVHLKLTTKLRSYLKHHKTASTVLQLTSSQTGRKKTVTAKTIKLKHKG